MSLPQNLEDRAGTQFWNERWASLPPFRPYEGAVFETHSVLKNFLRASTGRSAIEIGCVPGNYLVYLNKEFGYTVSGIDYSDRLDYVEANLAYHKVPVGRLINADLFKFVPDERYDLVFSHGFVEHFSDPQSVLTKHADLAKPGGLVVIIIPNLTHLHRFLCSTFDRANYKAHVLTLMYRYNLLRGLEETGLEVLHCEYNKTFRPPYTLPYPLSLASRAVQKLLRLMGMDNIGNSFASPYLVSVSRKPI